MVVDLVTKVNCFHKALQHCCHCFYKLLTKVLDCVTVLQCFCSGQSCASEDTAGNVDQDQDVLHFDRLQQLDMKVQHCGTNCSTDGSANSDKMTCSDGENGSDISETGAYRCSADTDARSVYANGATRLTDSVCNKLSDNCEQIVFVTECNKTSTTQQTVDRSPSQSRVSNSEITASPMETVDSAAKQDISAESSREENTTSSANCEDCTMLNCAADDMEAAIARCADVKVDECDRTASVDSAVCQERVQQNAGRGDSLQPLDFSVSGSAKTGVSTVRKSVPDDTQKAYPKHDIKSDSYRPVARLLHDLGLELVREQVYRDLIDIQTAKDAKNRLEEREKGQLLKLVEAQDRLALRNAPYQLPTKRCNRCHFMSPSTNVMTLHHEMGTVSRVDATVHVCCLCTAQPGFRTRNTAHFMVHLSTAHGLSGRLMKKMAPYSCNNCTFEHRSSVRLAVHVDKCVRKFSLTINLQPLPGDCDIPLIYRSSDRKRHGALPFVQPSTSSDASFTASGPPSVRTLLTSLKQQISAGHPGGSYTQLVMPGLICEICGKLVDGREALWGHFRSAHHVELCRTTMRDKEPWMKCDVCNGRFWTYQGLSRHLLLAHNRALATSFTSGTQLSPVAARCHLCGGSQTSNPLSHFSAYHNVTLLEMYHAKLCCLCNRKVNSGRAFEEHMVEQHSDIFANYDVLRTVLQALTTARYFKADDTREPTTQHIMQLSARSARTTDISADAPSHVRNKVSDIAQNASAAARSTVYAPTDVADKKSVTPTSSSHTLQRKRNSSDTVSRHGGQKKRLNTSVSVTKNKCTTPGSSCTRDGHIPETQTSAVKADKGATAEEVKKLYEDLADIGRPILRSMRRKLSTNSEAKSGMSEGSPSAVSVQSNSITTEKIPAKKVHLQSTDEDCADKSNDII